MRLILHTVTYWLMLEISNTIPRAQPLARGEFATIRLRLLKIAVRINETASRVGLAFAANCPAAALGRFGGRMTVVVKISRSRSQFE